VPEPLPPFWTLVEEHGAALLDHAQRLVGPSDAADVLGDALLRALRAYPGLAHGEHLRAWLYRIVTNVALDQLARDGRRELTSSGALPEAAAHDPGGVEAFTDLIAPLSDGAKAVLTLRYVADLPYAEIAARLGCSPPAARQRASTAIRSLRETLT